MLNPKALNCYPQAIPALAVPVIAVIIFKVLRLLKKSISFYSIHTKTCLTLHARTGYPKADSLTPDHETAHHLVANFAKDAWPYKDYEIIFDEGLNRLGAMAVKIAKKSSQIDMFKK